MEGLFPVENGTTPEEKKCFFLVSFLREMGYEVSYSDVPNPNGGAGIFKAIVAQTGDDGKVNELMHAYGDTIPDSYMAIANKMISHARVEIPEGAAGFIVCTARGPMLKYNKQQVEVIAHGESRNAMTATIVQR